MTTLRRITALMLWLGGAQSVDWTIVRATYTQPGSWGTPTRQYDVQPMLSSLIHPGVEEITFTVNDGLITGPPSHTGPRSCALWSGPAQLQVTMRCGRETSTYHFTQGRPAVLWCKVGKGRAFELNPSSSTGRGWWCPLGRSHMPEQPTMPWELHRELGRALFWGLAWQLDWQLDWQLAWQLSRELYKFTSDPANFDTTPIAAWIDRHITDEATKVRLKRYLNRAKARKRLFLNARVL